METIRQEKIARLLMKELGEIFLLYARDYQGTLISVSEVRVTADLSQARVFLSIFPSEKEEDMLAKIQAATKKIRFELGNRTRHQLRIIPELIFHIDGTFDYMENIDQLLQK